MIIVDTNVLSELMRPIPSPQVVDWVRQHERELHVSVVTFQELTYGVARMPAGNRRTLLQQAVDEALRAFHGKVLPITLEVSLLTGTLLATRLTAGRPISQADAQLAGTSLSHGAALATRNARDFEGLGITLVNPWD